MTEDTIITYSDIFGENTSMSVLKITTKQNPESNIETLIRKLAVEWINTDTGKQCYEFNNNNFTWDDFVANVPSDWLKERGIIIECQTFMKPFETFVESNEQLVNENDIT